MGAEFPDVILMGDHGTTEIISCKGTTKAEAFH